jgi:hypothetical protein
MNNFDNASTVAEPITHNDNTIGQFIARISNDVPFAISDRHLFDKALRIWTAWMNESAELRRIDRELTSDSNDLGCSCDACMTSAILEQEGYSLASACDSMISGMIRQYGREQVQSIFRERIDMIAAADMGIEVNSL